MYFSPFSLTSFTNYHRYKYPKFREQCDVRTLNNTFFWFNLRFNYNSLLCDLGLNMEAAWAKYWLLCDQICLAKLIYFCCILCRLLLEAFPSDLYEAVYIQKSLTGKLPAAVCREYKEYLPLRNNRSATRKILTIPKHKTQQFENSPLYRPIKTWNSIPQNLKDTESDATTFKKSYQILPKSFYHLKID